MKKGFKQTQDGTKIQYRKRKPYRVTTKMLQQTLLAHQIAIGVLPYKRDFVRCYDDLWKPVNAKKTEPTLSQCLYPSYIATTRQMIKEPYSLISDEDTTVTGLSRNILLYPIQSFHPKLLEQTKTSALLKGMDEKTLPYNVDFFKGSIEARRSILNELCNHGNNLRIGVLIEDRTRQYIFRKLDEGNDALTKEQQAFIDTIAELSAHTISSLGEESFYTDCTIPTTDDMRMKAPRADFLTERAVVEMKCTKLSSQAHVLQAVIYAVLLHHCHRDVKTIRLIYPLDFVSKTAFPLRELPYDKIPKTVITFLEDNVIYKERKNSHDDSK